jgi:hypothetical protein
MSSIEEAAPHGAAAHRVSMREKWRHMNIAQRAEHIRQPTHLYSYMSSFVPRGTTEGRIKSFFSCINHLGACVDGTSTKFALGADACMRIGEELDFLIGAAHTTELSGTVDQQALGSIMDIWRMAERDFAAQGWSYNSAENFAYRTPP